MLINPLSDYKSNGFADCDAGFLTRCKVRYSVWEYHVVQFSAAQKKRFALHRLVRLRQRYILTRGNKVRLRYLASTALVLTASAAFGLNSFALAPTAGNEMKVAAQQVAEIETAGGPMSQDVAQVPAVLHSHISDGIRKASAALKKAPQPKFREVEVASGQTVAGLLQKEGLSGPEAHYAVQALGKYFDVRKVRSGQKIGLHFMPQPDGTFEFSKMEMKLNPVKLVSITRNGPQDFRSSLEEKELVPRTYARKAQIQTSLYGSAAQARIPSQVIAEIIRIYSWDVDFQRDLRRGDKLEVLYETFESEDGEFARYGDILYASLSVGGKDIPIYRYEMNNGQVDYFQPSGMSIRKTLMKTPVDGARISSGFGMRHHPVLGYNKMHKGMDFAAPTGTPIYAAGDGTVEYSGRKGAYGNYVRIRHNSKLKTAYAHMHRIHKSSGKGARVEQGQIIGYVGTTGRSTGPHLHYEVLMNGKQVNPRSVDLPTGEQLAGTEMKRFESLRAAIYDQYVSLVEGMKYAQAPAEKSGDS